MAALALAATAPAAEASCSLAVVLVPCIEVTVPSSYAWGSLPPGTADSAEQPVVVSSNQPWGLRVSSDRADGRMAQWTGSAYAASPKTLANPLQWSLGSVNGSAQAAAYTALSGTAATVVTGRGATGCVLGALCGSDTIGVRYRQTVSYADRRASPDSYRLQVTYTATHGW